MEGHWARADEAGALRGMRFLLWAYKFAGRPLFNFMLFFAIAYFFLRRGDSRRASFDYLRHVRREYPEALGQGPIWWLSFRQFFAFGQATLDKYLAWVGLPAPVNMDPEADELLFNMAPKEIGSLLIGAHFGNIEYSQIIADRHPEVTINVLMHDQHARNFTALVEGKESRGQMNLIQVTDIDFTLALMLREKVQAGEWVVMAGDRVPVGDSSRVCEPTFFGEPARFPIGPYVLASLLQCPVYLLHCFRLDGDYNIGVEAFADEISPDRKERFATYEAYAQKFATALERQVIRSPLQWFNFYDFWGSNAKD